MLGAFSRPWRWWSKLQREICELASQRGDREYRALEQLVTLARLSCARLHPENQPVRIPEFKVQDLHGWFSDT